MAAVTTTTSARAGRKVYRVFSFPDPVNEISARLVAGGVVIMAASTIVFHLRWGTYILAYGFLARVLTGPKLSPLGQLVTRLITPALRVPPKLVPGPPKRFAQGIGLFVTSVAALFTALGLWPIAVAALAMIIGAATLESVFAYCLGCKFFGYLMRIHWIPPEVCERCNNIR